MTTAAGILYVCGERALFLQRADTGQWAFAGGHVEAGETAEDAARREAREELGEAPTGALGLLTRRIADGVDYTTFLARAETEFAPTLNGEHTAWTWAPIANPPQPLHPGCAVALARLTMDELGVARAMAAGDLVSPQQYGNVWLFAIRITGTGASYRPGLDEYVWRDGSIYLNDEFLARCNGLPVVWEHPDKDKPTLDSEEFNNRIIGAVMLPYIKGEEVWGVARIYDADSIALMRGEQLSTSPGVLFGKLSANKKVALEDGSHLLIEGAPRLLDHIAIVPNGVWDKGGAPTGVLNNTLTEEPIGMTEEEKAAADKARKDTADDRDAKIDAAQAKLDAALARLDAMEKDRKDAEDREAAAEKERKDGARRDAARKDRFGARKDGESDDDFKKRFDADEMAMCDALKEEGEEAAKDFAGRARKDAEEADKTVRDDRARKDAEEKQRMEREDAARADSALAKENTDLKAKLDALAAVVAGMTRETPIEERDMLAAAQARWDTAAAMFGERVPAPNPGETGLGYRRRLAQRFQRHSERFKDENLASFGAGAMSAAEDVIYADAVATARNTVSSAPGTLVPFVTRDQAGRQITTFHGDPMAWMQHFMGTGQHGKINRNPKAA